MNHDRWRYNRLMNLLRDSLVEAVSLETAAAISPIVRMRIQEAIAAADPTGRTIEVPPPAPAPHP